MEIKFVPPCCEPTEDLKGSEKISVPGKFAGSLLVEVPAYPVRTKLKQKILRSVEGAQLTEAKKLGDSAYELFAASFEQAKGMIKAVDVTHVASGKKCSTVKDLEEDPFFGEVAEEFAAFVWHGFKPSEK